jgi:hypothetical protein
MLPLLLLLLSASYIIGIMLHTPSFKTVSHASVVG